MTVVFGVDYDSLGADLAAALRAVDSIRVKVVSVESSEPQHARLVAICPPVEAVLTPALAHAAGSGVEIVALGDRAHEIDALDAGAADFIEWPDPRHSLEAHLVAAARRLHRASEQRGSFERLRRLDAARLRIVAADVDLEALLQMTCEELRALTAADNAIVEMIDGDDFVYRAVAGDAYPTGHRYPLEPSLSGAVLTEGGTLLCTDSESDPRPNRDGCRKAGIRSMVVTPLVCDGQAIGVLKIASPSPNRFGDVDQHMVQTMGELVSGAIQREMERARLRGRIEDHSRALDTLKKESDSLRSLATIDPLTGLFNRRHFAIVADEAVRRGGARAMLILDLDQFKSVNDSHGHAAGDAVLVAVAGWINGAVRDGDLVGRIGGEEFAILLPRVDQEAAVATAERIRAAIEAGAVPFEGEWLRTTVSIGVALVDIARTHEDSLRRADAALYRAKAGGRNRVTLHDESSVLPFPEAGAS